MIDMWSLFVLGSLCLFVLCLCGLCVLWCVSVCLLLLCVWFVSVRFLLGFVWGWLVLVSSPFCVSVGFVLCVCVSASSVLRN